ncbi:MAG: tetratricopeptide repeat protein, partial [Sedimentisphaerales bacterium]
MIKWFKNLRIEWQIAIFAAVVGAIGGIIGLLMNTRNSSTPQTTIRQNGTGNTAIVAEGNNITTNITTGIDPVLYGNAKEELGQAKEKIRHLEEQLAKPSLETSISSEKSIPVPSAEAKELAKLITQDDSSYAQALKAIAEGNNKKADGLLDETQKIIDHVQQAKDKAQAKIYRARMQNASYAGRPRDALQWCDKLKPLAGEDSQILNEIAVVYYNNANYKEAEPMYKRALAIDEASFGKDHPDVATDLSNLAGLYQATNRLSEAEPMYKRAMAIDE